MRFFARLFLIAALVLTSQGVASARGQSRALSELVICAGATVTTIVVDENGQPARRTDFCPDIAPLLLAAVVFDTAFPAAPSSWAAAVPAMPVMSCAGLVAPRPCARAPPGHFA
ncbi:hypothetical protein FQV27_06830 [Paracoccus aurantiacus]|uniref:DUF2946 domain-containing protein n=1 Tax=Paracoccus aurantiacus TaxID=2599412 RepID=A0A5C6S5P7_9RHOB|nr:hypothetical protein [Paracoccus aurantiacus]TXB69826.1 hypothetical protein FQV27_06830 [Paracoccus aurantiacus]